MSQAELARLVHVHPDLIAKIEKATRWPTEALATACDTALGTGGRLAVLWPRVAHERHRANLVRQPGSTAPAIHVAPQTTDDRPEEPSTVYRVSADEPSEPLGTTIGKVRQNIEAGLFAGSCSTVHLDDWEAVVAGHAEATRYRPPHVLLPDLVVDAADLGHLLASRRSASALRSLTRLTAHMAGMLSLTLLKLNDRNGSRQWARTARHAADESGDQATSAWVRAQEAHTHFYAGHLPQAVSTAREAQTVAATTPCAGSSLAAALEARALALLGQARHAQVALDAAEAILQRMPAEQDVWSALGYNEAQLRFHEGNALTHLGATDRAWQAQQRALHLYPQEDYLDRALVLLDRAACLARDGELDVATSTALTCLNRLTADQRQGLLTTRGREVLDMISATHDRTPGVRDLRDVLDDDHRRA